jgi:hypothetical protein
MPKSRNLPLGPGYPCRYCGGKMTKKTAGRISKYHYACAPAAQRDQLRRLGEGRTRERRGGPTRKPCKVCGGPMPTHLHARTCYCSDGCKAAGYAAVKARHEALRREAVAARRAARKAKKEKAGGLPEGAGNPSPILVD